MASFCVDTGRSGRPMMRVGSTTVCVASRKATSRLTKAGQEAIA